MKLIKSIIILLVGEILSFCILYLLVAFIEFEMDASKWTNVNARPSLALAFCAAQMPLMLIAKKLQTK